MEKAVERIMTAFSKPGKNIGLRGIMMLMAPPQSPVVFIPETISSISLIFIFRIVIVKDMASVKQG